MKNLDAECSKDYIETIHKESKGYITKAKIENNRYSQWHYFLKKLEMQDFRGENVYISMNTFYKPQRRIENIKEINALYIDLDIYNLGIMAIQGVMWLEDEFFRNKLPQPTYIISSGRGLYLIWKIEPVPSMALPLWKAIEEFFYRELKELGADRKCLDVTRILRVPGSINSKSNSEVEIIENYGCEYTLREIKEEYMPELKPKEEKKGRPLKVVSIYRERSLYLARINDLVKLCELRRYDLRGTREYVLFLYRYYACYFTEDAEKALEDIIELNDRFIYPLKKREVVSATKSAEVAYNKSKKYKYKNETLIEILGITEEEQKELQTIISNKEYKRRKGVRNKKQYKKTKKVVLKTAKQKYKEKLKEMGKTTEKVKITNRQKKVLALTEQGLKRQDICNTINISIETYKRDRKQLREKGFL